MSLPIIDGNTEKTVENIYSRVKHEISLHPKASIAGLLTVAGLTKAISFLQTKNPDDLGSISQAGSRVFQLYSPEIISNSMDAFDSVAKGLYESGASQILKDEGISGLKNYIPLACAGIIQGAEGYGKKEKTVTRKEVDFNKEKEDKHGHGRLYVGGVLFLGCIGGTLIYLSNIGESTGTPPQSTGIDPVSDPIIPVETDAPVHAPEATATAELTQEPTPTETPVETQHLYDLNPSTFDYIKIEADDNLFGIEIEGSKVFDSISGWESIYDDDENRIFQRETYTPRNFDLYSELQPGQARALEAEYGSMVSVKMEQIDTDGNGELDKVAVQFVGSKGTLEFETEIYTYGEGTIANVGPAFYIRKHLNL